MENTIIKETTDVLKRLSPNNQIYFMTMVRLAEAAENGVRNREPIPGKPCPSLRANTLIQRAEAKELSERLL